MTYQEFLQNFYSRVLPNSIRQGQALINYLWEVNPELCNLLQEPENKKHDCFYRENLIGSFLFFLSENWKS